MELNWTTKFAVNPTQKSAHLYGRAENKLFSAEYCVWGKKKTVWLLCSNPIGRIDGPIRLSDRCPRPVAARLLLRPSGSVSEIIISENLPLTRDVLDSLIMYRELIIWNRFLMELEYGPPSRSGPCFLCSRWKAGHQGRFGPCVPWTRGQRPLIGCFFAEGQRGTWYSLNFPRNIGFYKEAPYSLFSIG